MKKIVRFWKWENCHFWAALWLVVEWDLLFQQIDREKNISWRWEDCHFWECFIISCWVRFMISINWFKKYFHEKVSFWKQDITKSFPWFGDNRNLEFVLPELRHAVDSLARTLQLKNKKRDRLMDQRHVFDVWGQTTRELHRERSRRLSWPIAPLATWNTSNSSFLFCTSDVGDVSKPGFAKKTVETWFFSARFPFYFRTNLFRAYQKRERKKKRPRQSEQNYKYKRYRAHKGGTIQQNSIYVFKKNL